VLVGRTVEDAINFQLAIGPAGEVFREAGKEAEAKRGKIEAALTAAIKAQKKEADGIVMDFQHDFVAFPICGGRQNFGESGFPSATKPAILLGYCGRRIALRRDNSPFAT
jgi:hypothetical protein